MAWGAHEKWLRRQAEQDGDLPRALQEKPDVLPHLEFVWLAYSELRSERQSGMDRGSILFSSIDAFASRYGIDGVDEFDTFRRLIRAMDDEEMRFKVPDGN